MSPKIVSFALDGPLDAGDMAQLNCIVSQGDTPLKISWTFHGPDSSTRTQSGVQVVKVGEKSSLLIIDSVTADHSGNYTCTARNVAGETNYTTEVIVNGKTSGNNVMLYGKRL